MNAVTISPTDLVHTNLLAYTQQVSRILDDALERSSNVHRAFLRIQSQTSKAITDLTGSIPTMKLSLSGNRVIFSKQQLEEFAIGSIARCFGPRFKELDQRKTPRLPNGRLLLVDRVIQITGTQMDLSQPASIVTEFDIQSEAWFLQSNPYQGIPLAILMEIALQPCGFLSAYLGTSLMIPAANNIFRNLDGWIQLSPPADLRGNTITSKVMLTRTINGGGVYIQAYRFELSSNDRVFLCGETTFGYFTQPMMDEQSGLGQKEDHQDWIIPSEARGNFLEIQKVLTDERSYTEKALLDQIDSIWFDPNGGSQKLGKIVCLKKIDGDEWFFADHFYQDPVMPGSLGVEIIPRALAAVLQKTNPGLNLNSAHIEIPEEKQLRWKYRGQVLPSNKKMQVEIVIKEQAVFEEDIRVTADANFWVDDLWIYSVENLSMVLKGRITR